MAPNLGSGRRLRDDERARAGGSCDRHDDIPAGLAEWERRERPLTDHTQRISTIYGWPGSWPPRIRAWFYDFAHKNPWIDRQRLRAATHVPLGWEAEAVPARGEPRRRSAGVGGSETLDSPNG